MRGRPHSERPLRYESTPRLEAITPTVAAELGVARRREAEWYSRAGMGRNIMRLSAHTTEASASLGRQPSPCAPRLIAAAPAISLVERWRGELAVLQRRSPGSDAAGTLADCLRELVDAINTGDDVTLQLTVADAHAISRIPLSTLRWLCKHKPIVIGARKHEGIWYLDRARFQEYIDRPVAPLPRVADDAVSRADSVVPARVERSADLAARAG
jgi:hypothetical protein